MKMENAFKTGKALQWAIDNKEQVDGMEEYLDSAFMYSACDLDYGSSPTWEEAFNDQAAFEAPDWIEGNEDKHCQLVHGYHEPFDIGDMIGIDGALYRYTKSISLYEEEEHQAENGTCAYDYRGPSFLRVFAMVFDSDGEYCGPDIPQEAIDACSGPGDASSAVAHWAKELAFVVPRKLAVDYLNEFGAWDDLETTSIETLTERVFWIACGDMRDNEEWFGLIH